MDLTSLRYFYTIAKEGSFMAAAKKLDYAQSNLSTRIGQMEKEYGTKLLNRSRGGVSLTEKGQLLYDYAEKILTLTAEAESTIREDAYECKSLTISSMESAAVSFLPDILSAFHRADPDTHVCVKTGTSAAGVRAVLKGESDLAIAVGRNANEALCSVPLKKETLTLAADSSVPSDTSLPDLLQRPLLVFPQGCAYRRALEELLEDMGIAPVQIMEFTSLGALLASASAGLGICLFPESAFDSFTAGNTLRRFTVPEHRRTAEIYMIYRKHSKNNRTLMRFVEQAGKELCKK